MTELTPDAAAEYAAGFLTRWAAYADGSSDEPPGDLAPEYLHVLLAERKQILRRLTNPCNGEDCETGGAAHCHRCAEAESDTLLADVLTVESAIRTHLETHDLAEWAAEIMRLRENKPPATVYQVAVFNAYDAPDQVELFNNRPAAEAYKAQLPGSELEQVPVLDHAPTRVTVHHYETWVLPDGVTMSPRGPRLHHSKQERWSHDLWPPPEQWTHPGDHTHIVHPTTEPVVCLLETYGFDRRATWQAHLDEEARLRKEGRRHE